MRLIFSSYANDSEAFAEFFHQPRLVIANDCAPNDLTCRPEAVHIIDPFERNIANSDTTSC